MPNFPAPIVGPITAGSPTSAVIRVAGWCRLRIISLGDPAEAACELERAVKAGCHGAFVCPFTITRKPHGHPDHDRVFAAAQDLNIPLAIHPTLEPVAWSVHQRFDGMGWADWYFDLFAAQGVPQAFATFFQFGVFDRFPKLRAVVLESGAGWVGYWLDRGDAIYRRTTLGGTVQLKERPSYYFKRQCFISADPDERSIAALTKLVGEDRFFWASDYPHPDHPGDYLEELRGMVDGMTTNARRGVLGENVAQRSLTNLPHLNTKRRRRVSQPLCLRLTGRGLHHARATASRGRCLCDTPH